MKKFLYLLTYISDRNMADWVFTNVKNRNVKFTLTELGLSGWELVSVYSPDGANTNYFIFKKEL